MSMMKAKVFDQVVHEKLLFTNHLKSSNHYDKKRDAARTHLVATVMEEGLLLVINFR